MVSKHLEKHSVGQEQTAPCTLFVDFAKIKGADGQVFVCRVMAIG